MRRAASILAFCAAMAAAVMFPDAQGVGFSPLQIPPDLVDTDPDYRPDDSRFRMPALCENLGGQLRNEQQVCSGLDKAGSFCIVGSANAFPCRGLFKHVIECNAKYNRPAHNMFLCASRCDDENQKARGAKCERIFPPSQAVPSPLSTVFAAVGYSGAAGGVSVAAGHTLEFAPSAEVPGFASRPRPPNHVDYELTAPLTVALTVSLAAAIMCDGCYPVPAALSAFFIPVFAPVQPTLRAARLEDAAITLRPPADFAQNASITIIGVSPPAEGFAVARGTILTRQGGAPADGTYEVTAAMTHPGMRGVLTLLAAAEIAPLAPLEQPVLRAGFLAESRITLRPPADFAENASITIIGVSPPAEGFAVERGTILTRIIGAPPEGTYEITTAMTHPDFPASLTLTLLATAQIARLPPLPQDILRVGFLAESEITLRPPADFAENASITIIGVSPPGEGFAVERGTILTRIIGAPPEGTYEITTAMTHPDFPASLTLTLLATAAIIGLEPVSQDILRAVYDQAAELPLRLSSFPEWLQSGGQLSIAGVSPPTDGFELTDDAVLTRPPRATDAGTYAVSIALSHSNLPVALTLTAVASIAPATLEATHRPAELNPAVKIPAVPGAVGDVYAVSLTLADAVFRPAADADFSLTPAPDNPRRATLKLTAPLSAGTEKTSSLAFTVARAPEVNYIPLAQTLRVTVAALAALSPQTIPVTVRAASVAARTEVLRARPFLPAQFAVEFVRASGDDELDISAEGTVFTAVDLSSGRRTYRMAASAESADFLGAARVTFEFSVFPASVDFNYEWSPAHGGSVAAFAAQNSNPLPTETTTTLAGGAQVTLTARPSDNWHVSGWSHPDCEPVAGINPHNKPSVCVLDADFDLFVTAHFTTTRAALFDERKIHGHLPGHGVFSSGSRISERATVLMSVNFIEEGHEVACWRSGYPSDNVDDPCAEECAGAVVRGDVCGIDLSEARDGLFPLYLDTRPTPQPYSYGHIPADGRGGTLVVAPLGGGSGIVDGIGIYGEGLTFIATPAEGWMVNRWDSASNVPRQSCKLGKRAGERLGCRGVVGLESKNKLTVHFSPARRLRFSEEDMTARRVLFPEDEFALEDEQDIPDDAMVSLSARPPANHEAARWLRNGEEWAECAVQPECVIVPGENDLSVAVEFRLIPRAVDLAGAPAEGGTLLVEGEWENGFAPHGATLTFVADPADGWHVREWGAPSSCASGVADETVRCEWTADRPLQASVLFSRPIVNVDDVLHPSARAAQVSAADGYAGLLHALTLSMGFGLEDSPEFDPPGKVAFDPQVTAVIIPHDRPLNAAADGRFTATMRADVICDALCEPPKVTFAVDVIPVINRTQNTLRAVYGRAFAPPHLWVAPASIPRTGEVFPLDGILPSGMLTIAAISNDADDNAFRIDNRGLLTLADDPAHWPDAGAYEISVLFTHHSFLGSLAMPVSAVVDPAPLGAEYHLQAMDGFSPTITTAADHHGAVYVVSLSDPSADAILRPPTAGEMFSLALSPDARRATVRLSAPLPPETIAAKEFTVEVVRLPEKNYHPLAQTFRVEVSALSRVPQARLFAGNPQEAARGFHDFRAALDDIYALADFEQNGGDMELTVSAEGRVGFADENGTLGLYTLVADVRRPSRYVGVARATVAALVARRGRLLAPSPPLAAEYAGEVFRILASVEFGGARFDSLPDDAAPLRLVTTAAASSVAAVEIPAGLQPEPFGDIHTLVAEFPATVGAVFSFDGIVINTAGLSFVQTVLAKPPRVTMFADAYSSGHMADALTVFYVWARGVSTITASLSDVHFEDPEIYSMVTIGESGEVWFSGGTLRATTQFKIPVRATAAAFLGTLTVPLRVRHKCTAPVDEDGRRIYQLQSTERGRQLVNDMAWHYGRARLPGLCDFLQAGADPNGTMSARVTDPRQNFSGADRSERIFHATHLQAIIEDGVVTADDIRALDMMLLAGADINARTEEGGGSFDWGRTDNSLIHSILASNHGLFISPNDIYFEDLLRYVLERDDFNINRRGWNGETPLILMVNREYDDGRHPGRLDYANRIFELILTATYEAGGLYHTVKEYYNPTLYYGDEADPPCNLSSFEFNHLLARDRNCGDDGVMAIHAAARQGEQGWYWVDRMLDLDEGLAGETDVRGVVPLSYAVRDASATLAASILLARGDRGSKDSRDFYGMRPIHYAAWQAARHTEGDFADFFHAHMLQFMNDSDVTMNMRVLNGGTGGGAGIGFDFARYQSYNYYPPGWTPPAPVWTINSGSTALDFFWCYDELTELMESRGMRRLTTAGRPIPPCPDHEAEEEDE